MVSARYKIAELGQNVWETLPYSTDLDRMSGLQGNWKRCSFLQCGFYVTFFKRLLGCAPVACWPCSSALRMRRCRRSNGSRVVCSNHWSCLFERQCSTGRQPALWRMYTWGTLCRQRSPRIPGCGGLYGYTVGLLALKKTRLEKRPKAADENINTLL